MSDNKFHYNKVPGTPRVKVIYEVATDVPGDVRYTLGVVFREEGKRTWDATSVHEDQGFYGRAFKTRDDASVYLRQRHTDWVDEQVREVVSKAPEPAPDTRSDAQRYVDSRTPRKYARHG